MATSAAKNTNSVIQIAKAVIIAVIISLASILIAALAIKIFNLQNSSIPVINQFIKGVSILLACLFCLKGAQNGWIKGLFVGVLYALLGYCVFSFLDNSFDVTITLLNDVAIASLSGILSGIISANL